MGASVSLDCLFFFTTFHPSCDSDCFNGIAGFAGAGLASFNDVFGIIYASTPERNNGSNEASCCNSAKFAPQKLGAGGFLFFLGAIFGTGATHAPTGAHNKQKERQTSKNDKDESEALTKALTKALPSSSA